MKTTRAVIVLSLLLGGAPALRAGPQTEPGCLEECARLTESGELRAGVSEAGCQIRLCQENARRAYKRREFELSLASLDLVKARLATSPAYQFDRGLAYYGLGRFEDAVEAFDRALAGSPNNIRAGAQRAHALVRLERIPEARAQFEQMLEWPGTDGQYRDLRTRSYLLGNLGVLRLTEGDAAGAKKLLDEALEVDGRNRLARSFRGDVLPALESKLATPGSLLHLTAAFEELSLGKPESALKQVQSVLVSSPDFRLGYLLGAEIQRKYLNYAACEDTLRKAESRFPDDTTIYAERIRCSLLRHGVRAPASRPSIQELKELARKDPKHPLVQEILILLDE